MFEQMQEEFDEMLEDTPELEFTEASLGKLRKGELVELCEQRELDSDGLKSELIARLLSYAKDTQVIEAESHIVVVKEKGVKGERI